jgi:hypothetical protein
LTRSGDGKRRAGDGESRAENHFESTHAEIYPQPKKNVAKQNKKPYFQPCPISHVPVVVCQSVGIRTRGRTAAKG